MNKIRNSQTHKRNIISTYNFHTVYIISTYKFIQFTNINFHIVCVYVVSLIYNMYINNANIFYVYIYILSLSCFLTISICTCGGVKLFYYYNYITRNTRIIFKIYNVLFCFVMIFIFYILYVH